MYSVVPVPSTTAGRAHAGANGAVSDLGLAVEDMTLNGAVANGKNGNGYEDEYDEVSKEAFGQNVEHACRWVAARD